MKLELEIETLLFREGAALSPADRLGARMAALYRCWNGRAPVHLVALTAALLRWFGGLELPLGRACLLLAEKVAAWGGHAYHSAVHHAEVVTNAAVLATLAERLGHKLPTEHVMPLLAAALAHDYQYMPGRETTQRFEAEQVSAAAIDEVACRCGVSDGERRDIGLLILATEPRSRRFLASGGRCEAPAPLAPLVPRPELVGLAAVLSDADLLSSAGLSMRWHQVQLARLERELGFPILPAEDAAFFSEIVGDDFLSLGGRYFTPNLVRIRAAACHRLTPAW